MSRPREHNPVSLFPFLAVLVCAMGALILLLLVTTRRIRSEALARAAAAAHVHDERASGLQISIAPVDDDEPSPRARPGHLKRAAPTPAPRAARVPEPPVAAPRPPARPFDPNPELRERIAALSTQRDRHRARLRAVEAELTTARERAETLQTRVGDLDRRLDDTRSQRESARRALAELEEQERRLAAQIHELDRRIAEARQQQAVAASRYVVVPYDGVSGTNRRPVLIEFTDEGLRFIPENVLLRKEDFEGFTPGYNPLLAGARALVDYWSAQSRGTDEPPPYVLLIVRPSGVRFYPLRLLLERLGQPFGYELLEEDQELALPPRDEGAAAACRTAVERLLQQRNALLAAVRSSGDLNAGAADPRLGPGGTGADDARVGVGGSDGASNRLDGPGTGPGERRGPVFRGYQRPSYDLVEPDTGIVLPNRPSRPLVVHRPGSRGAGPGAIVEGTPDRGSMPAPWSGSSNDPALPGSPGGGAGTTNVVPSTPGDGPARMVPWSPERDTIATEVLPGPDGNGEPGTRHDSGTLADGGPGGDFGWPRGDSAHPSRSIPRTFTGPARPLDEPATSFSEPGHPLGSLGSGEPIDRESGARHFAPGATPLTSRDQRSGEEPSPFSFSTSTAAPSAQSPAGAPPSGWPSAAAGPDGTPTYALPPLSFPTSRQTNDFDPTRPHHRRWGLSNPRATIGFEREVRIEVASDRLVVAGAHTIEVGRGESRDELVRRTLQAVEATAQGWGPPPDAFYWLPALRFRVAPGGNQHYERLRGPLREWGLSSSATYTLDSTTTPSFPGSAWERTASHPPSPAAFPGGAWERGKGGAWERGLEPERTAP